MQRNPGRCLIKDESGRIIPLPMNLPTNEMEDKAASGDSTSRPRARFFPPLTPLLLKPADIEVPIKVMNRPQPSEVRKALFKEGSNSKRPIKSNTKPSFKKPSCPVKSSQPPTPKIIYQVDSPVFKELDNSLVGKASQCKTDGNHLKPQLCNKNAPQENAAQKSPAGANSDGEFEAFEEAIEQECQNDKGDLRLIVQEMRELFLEADAIFEEYDHRMKCVRSKITQLFTKAGVNIAHNKENEAPSKRLVKNNNTPARQSADLRKSVLTKSVNNCVIESPRTQKALNMYNAMRENCKLLLTPQINKTQHASPKNISKLLSLNVQKQCLLLQETPKPK